MVYFVSLFQCISVYPMKRKLDVDNKTLEQQDSGTQTKIHRFTAEFWILYQQILRLLRDRCYVVPESLHFKSWAELELQICKEDKPGYEFLQFAVQRTFNDTDQKLLVVPCTSLNKRVLQSLSTDILVDPLLSSILFIHQVKKIQSSKKTEKKPGVSYLAPTREVRITETLCKYRDKHGLKGLDIEFLSWKELGHPIVDHVEQPTQIEFVPSKEIKALQARIPMFRTKCPRISSREPLSRYYGLKPKDIIRTTTFTSSGVKKTYRLVT